MTFPFPVSKRTSCCGCCGDYNCANRVIFSGGSVEPWNAYGVILGTTAGPKAWCYDPTLADFTGDFVSFGWAETLQSYGQFSPYSMSASGIYPSGNPAVAWGVPGTLGVDVLLMWFVNGDLSGIGLGLVEMGLAYTPETDLFRVLIWSNPSVWILYTVAGSSWNPCDSNTLTHSTGSGNGSYPSTITLTPYTTPPGGDGLSPSGCECQNPVCPGDKLPNSIPFSFVPDGCTFDIGGRCGPATITMPTLSETLDLAFVDYTSPPMADSIFVCYSGGACITLLSCPGPWINSLSYGLTLYLGMDGKIYYQFDIAVNCIAFPSSTCSSLAPDSSGYLWGSFFPPFDNYDPDCPGLGKTISLSMPVTVSTGVFGVCPDAAPCNPLTGTLSIG